LDKIDHHISNGNGTLLQPVSQVHNIAVKFEIISALPKKVAVLLECDIMQIWL